MINTVAKFRSSLASGISDNATSLTLASTDANGHTLQNGDYGFVIDEGTVYEEFVIGTLDSDTGIVSSLKRGVSYLDDTEGDATAFAHRKGASVKITDHPALSIITRKIPEFDRTSVAVDTNIWATRDCFVIASWLGDATNGLYGITIYSDGTSTPTTVAAISPYSGVSANNRGFVMAPVKKGNFFRVEVNDYGNGGTILSYIM